MRLYRYKNSKHEIPAFAEAPALCKASGGGASRWQVKFKTITNFQNADDVNP